MFERIGCSSDTPKPVYVGRVTGEFKRLDGGLFVGNLYHTTAAWVGDWFGIQKLTHCVPDLRYGQICDPIITHWEWKTSYIIDAQHRYMGLRCDPAAADVKEAAVHLISLLIPLVGSEDAENIWELIKMAWEVASAGSQDGAIAALTKFNETASWVYAKLLMKYGSAAHPQAAGLMTAIDFARDMKSLIERGAGCAWLP